MFQSLSEDRGKTRGTNTKQWEDWVPVRSFTRDLNKRRSTNTTDMSKMPPRASSHQSKMTILSPWEVSEIAFLISRFHGITNSAEQVETQRHRGHREEKSLTIGSRRTCSLFRKQLTFSDNGTAFKSHRNRVPFSLTAIQSFWLRSHAVGLRCATHSSFLSSLRGFCFCCVQSE